MIRERGGEGVGCMGQIKFESKTALLRLSIGELRYHAGEIHGVRNASLLSRADLVDRLCKHFLVSHGVDLEGENQDMDSLNSRLSGVSDMLPGSRLVQVEGGLLGGGQHTVELVHHSDIQSNQSDRRSYMTDTEGSRAELQLETVETGETEHQFILEATPSGDEESDYSILADSGPGPLLGGGGGEEEYSGEDSDTEEDQDRELVVEVLHRDSKSREPARAQAPCQAYVIAKSVKELRDLGRDMLRIHAENHGVEYAAKLRMSELVREMIQHYNGVHRAGLEVSKLDMLKLNMLELKKIKVDVREKTPPPDTSKMVPKNVVPIEEQVHHVYEKRPDVCTVEIIVTNLKDMLALGTSILRPEASKHRVCNSSRKQKLQVVEELWEHYLKFHLKGGDADVDDRLELSQQALLGAGEWSHHSSQYQEHSGSEDTQEFIIVSEEDIVAGEDIHTAGEEVTA